MLEIDSANGEEKRRKEITSQVVKALRGDAYRIAMDIGTAAFMADDGIPKLVAALLLTRSHNRGLKQKNCTVQGTQNRDFCRDNAERVSTPSCRGDVDGGSS